MALIGKIRERSWILVGFIALALFIFILEAAFDSGSRFFGSRKTDYGEVNGKAIQGKDYEQALSDYKESIKAINPNIQFTDQIESQLKEDVWSTMVAKQLLGKTYSQLGLEPTPNELKELMFGDRPHPIAQQFIYQLARSNPEIVDQNTGQLNQSKIRELITNLDQIDKQNGTHLRETIRSIENLIRTDQVKQKYSNLVAQSFYVPTFMAKEVLGSSKARKISIVSAPYTSLKDDNFKVTDAEISEYINNNKAKFTVDASAALDVVKFDIFPSSQDSADALKVLTQRRDDFLAASGKDSAFIARYSEQRQNVDYFTAEEVTRTTRNADTIFNLPVGTLTNIYNEGSYYMFTKIIDRRVAPDTVRAAHILLSLGKDDNDKDAAYAKADSLIKIVASGKANFGQLAADNSLDEGSKKKGGDLGYFARGQMVKPFNDKVFYSGMQPGQIAKVESQYGLHIILLLDVKAPKLMTKFADFAAEISPSDATITDIESKAQAFYSKSRTAKDFDKNAKTENLIKDIVVTKNTTEVPQLGNARKLVQWAFEQKKADEVGFTDYADKYVVAKLTRQIPKGLARVEDVREEVATLVRNEKKGKDLVGKLTNAAAGNADLATIASKVEGAILNDTALVRFNSAFIPNVGQEPKLVGTAFGVGVGQTSKAVAGNENAFIVRVNAEEPAPEQTEDIQAYKQMFMQRFASRFNFQTIMESIMKKKDVEDLRYKFF